VQVLLSHAAGYSMAKTLRVAAIALALMLAGVVGLAWFFANTDLDQRRGDLADWLSTETGYEVRIDGKLAVRHALRHALWPHLTVEDLSVWTLTDGERQLLAKVEELTLVVNPFDLLLRGLLIDEVMLRGAEVNLVRDAAGRDSWMAERGEAARSPSATLSPKRRPASNSSSSSGPQGSAESQASSRSTGN
jgi:uncharacterized protein involved in outer membrane biogenesis